MSESLGRMVQAKRARWATAAVLLAIFSVLGCGPNPRIMNSVEEKRDEKRTERPDLSPFEADLKAMRTAEFAYIYVLRRKDGAEMSAEDRSFVNANTPIETNRRKVSDEGKAIILGSNFEFEQKVLDGLQARFAFEDHSKPQPGGEKEANGGDN